MIHSHTLSHSDITAALGLEPTWTADGETVTWVLEQPGEDEQFDDGTGSLCLEKLVARLECVRQIWLSCVKRATPRSGGTAGATLSKAVSSYPRNWSAGLGCWGVISSAPFTLTASRSSTDSREHFTDLPHEQTASQYAAPSVDRGQRLSAARRPLRRRTGNRATRLHCW